MTLKRLNSKFYTQDVLTVAPELIGKILVHRLESGEELRYRITETEAYRGEEDTGCHAKSGKTNRTKTLYEKGTCKIQKNETETKTKTETKLKPIPKLKLSLIFHSLFVSFLHLYCFLCIVFLSNFLLLSDPKLHSYILKPKE